MNLEYQILGRAEINDSVRRTFAAMLQKQGKVEGDLATKADRCKLICLARVDGEVVAIGAVKKKTHSDFSREKAGIPHLANEFDWELGYLYTEEIFRGRGVASTVARLLVETYGKGNLMASTEIDANPGMVRILERLGFRLFGTSWKSGIHDNYLGLFLKFT